MTEAERLRLVAKARARAAAAGADPVSALIAEHQPDPRNPDGTYGTPPPGMVLNPETGQMEDMRSPINPNVPQGRGAALAMGAGQGLGFGGFDEAVAGAGSLFGNGYDYELARMREADRRAQQDHPGAYYSGLIPGAVASSVGAGKFLGVNPVGKTATGTLARGAGIGGTEGAIFGGLSGEGGNDRAKEAIRGGLIGAGVGMAAPPAVYMATKGARVAGDVLGGGIDAAFGRANADRAGRAVVDTVKKSKKNMDEISAYLHAAAREGQPEARLMDATGKAGQRRASGIVRTGGDGAEELAQFLERRQLGQADRVGGFVEDAFGFNGKGTGQTLPIDPRNPVPLSSSQILAGPQRSAAQTTDALTAARGSAADRAYGAAREGAAPVDVRGALAAIDDRIGGMSGSGVTGDGIDAKLARYRDRLAAPSGKLEPGVSARELSDFDRVLGVKQAVQDDIGAAVRAGRNNEARELGKLVKELDSALESSSGPYRAANDGFREASGVIGAVDEGTHMAARGRATDNVQRFGGMPRDQQSAARIGYGDNLLGRIEAATAPTSNKAKVLQSPKRDAEAAAMALDPALYGRRLSRENDMWQTQNRALGGSLTADNLSDVADGGMIADAGRALKSGLSGNFGNALGTVGARVAQAAGGQNEATRSIIAKMLMSSEPEKVLAKALRKESMSQGRKRILESLTRALGRSALAK